jgi:hypothetical protein
MEHVSEKLLPALVSFLLQKYMHVIRLQRYENDEECLSNQTTEEVADDQFIPSD